MENRKIDWGVSITNITLLVMFTILYIGAIVYSVKNMADHTTLEEAMFWGFMAIFIVGKLNFHLMESKFIGYKDAEVEKGESKDGYD